MIKFNKKVKLLFTLVFVFSGMLTLSQTCQVYVSKLLLDSSVDLNFHNITLNIILFISSIIIILFCEFMRKDCTSRLNKELLISLRSYACNGINFKKTSKFSEINVQEYISIFNNDIEDIIGDYYLNIPIIYFQVFSIIVYSIFIFMLNPILAIIIIVSNVLTVLTPYLFSNKLQEGKVNQLELMKRYNVSLGDFIKGQLIIRTNRINSTYNNILQEKSNEVAHKEYMVNRCRAYSDIATGAVSYLGYILTFIVGVLMISSQKLSFGGLLACIQISDLLVGPSISLASQINSFNGIKIVKKNFYELFKFEDVSEKIKCNKINTISLKNISYRYKSGFNISNFTYQFKENKKYLIYGENGSGKSTIFKILLNLISPDEGNVLIDGKNLKNIDEDSYFENIGIVLQQPFLFNETLLNNLTFFQNQDKNKIVNILTKLHVNHLISDIFNNRQYHENKSNISGGEKQKICLARILLQNKKFIFLDEATASIDKISSEHIERLLLEKEDICVVNIAHNLNKDLIKLYDEIICINDGEIYKIIKTSEEKEIFIDELH